MALKSSFRVTYSNVADILMIFKTGPNNSGAELLYSMDCTNIVFLGSPVKCIDYRVIN